ncbi:acyl carrier protein [Helicobacter sp. MIT 05-5294]|uniref:acyl carrier protein n=1 Tax=Helicobacter sp. MIT 05-5294 TaxID=1548150 RepID=UPI00051F8BA2|nr:acyl carrier protein [Helicobacter sp. MIT 05-5294]TLD85953.1 acyl carrier protein [Helicobacter sp. MIT 05-5294]
MIKDEVREFLSKRGVVLQDFEATETFSVIDSMGFLELLNTLEENHNRELDLGAFDPDEFRTLGRFCALVESLEKNEKH